MHINMTTLQVHILKHREGTSEHECKIFATELLFLNLKKKKGKRPLLMCSKYIKILDSPNTKRFCTLRQIKFWYYM